MLKLKTLRFALLTFAMAMVVNLALSEVTFAKQKRGRGRFSDKKAEKFINGHDARDGRWDGRGPRFRFGDRRDRDERFRFRDRRDRDEFRRDQWRRDEFRRDEWRQNELRRRRILPGRRF
jgi:hypothetical protein